MLRPARFANAFRQKHFGAMVLRILLPLCMAVAVVAAPSAYAVLVNPNFDQGPTFGVTDPGWPGNAVDTDIPGWTLTHYYFNGTGSSNPHSISDLNLQTSGGTNISILAEVLEGDTATLSPYRLYGATPTPTLLTPLVGTRVADINPNSGTSNPVTGETVVASNATALSQTETLTNDDVDPIDGLAHIRFSVAPVLQNPNHAANQQPFTFIEITNISTGGTQIFYAWYVTGTIYPFLSLTSAGVNIGSSINFQYMPWQSVDVAPGPPLMSVGDTVQITIIGSGCSPGGHVGQVYVDGSRRTPGSGGLAITATAAVPVASPGTVTYSYSYSNNSAVGANLPIGKNATITINPPMDSSLDPTKPNYSIQSFTADSSLSCTQSGTTLTCSVIDAIPDATVVSNALQVTYNVPAAAVSPLHMTNYTIAASGVQLLIGPEVVSQIATTQQTITFANPGAQPFGTNPTLSATSTSGLAVTFSSTTQDVCTVTPAGVLTFVSLGTCTINADQAGNATYVPAATVTNSFTVAQGPQTITFDNPGTQTFGTQPQLVATASSGLPVTFSSATPSICSVTTDGLLMTLATGTCTINADQTGNDDYLAADEVSQSFAISQDAARLTLSASPNPTVIGNPVTITATVVGDPPTGTVTFCDGAGSGSATCTGGTTLCTQSLTVGTTNSTAVCTATFTSKGNHALSAYYAGDNDYSATATAQVLVEAVDAALISASMLDRFALLLLGGLVAVTSLMFVHKRL